MTVFELTVHIAAGFTQRALAKLAAHGHMAAPRAPHARWLLATFSGELSQLDFVCHRPRAPRRAPLTRRDQAHWAALGYVQAVYVRVAAVSEPLLATLARARARTAGNGDLLLEAGDMAALIGVVDVARERAAWATWAAHHGRRSACQTLGVRGLALGGEDVRAWARRPVAARVGELFLARVAAALELPSEPIYRLPPKGGRCDMELLLAAHGNSETWLSVLVAHFPGKPGLQHQRFRGADAPNTVMAADNDAAAVVAAAEVAAAAAAAAGAADDAAGGDEGASTTGAVPAGDGAKRRKAHVVIPRKVWSVETPPERLRRAETVLRARTARLIVVIDKAHDWHNVNAIFRTCDALGVQHVWVITPVEGYKGTDDRDAVNRRISKSSEKYLSLRIFDTRVECVAALRGEPNLRVWAADVNDQAERLELPPAGRLAVPPRLALVMGHERLGVSRELLDLADKHVYLPIFGFGSSLNLSVATALIVQRIFDLAPDLRGAMAEPERAALRAEWFVELAKGDAQVAVARELAARPGGIPPLDNLRREVIRTRPKARSSARLDEAERGREQAAKMKLNGAEE